MTERAKGILVIVLAVGLFILLMGMALQQSNPLVSSPSLDGGYYLYVGQQIVSGHVPYRDVWESKPPGIFYINAVGLVLGRGTRWGIWALEFLGLLGAALLGFQVMRKKFGLFPALFGTLIWIWGYSRLANGGGYTEEFSLPFGFLAILAFLQSEDRPAHPWDFIVGLTFAINFLFRANNTGIQVSIVLAWLWMSLARHEFRQLGQRLLWSGLGMLIGLGLAAAFLAFQGVLQQAINAAILYNFYITGAHINVLSSLISGLSLIAVPAGLMLAGYLALTNEQADRRSLNPFGLFLLIDVPVEVLMSGLSGRNYSHYFMLWLPAIGLLSAFLISLIAPRLDKFVERYSPYSVFVVFIVFVLFSAPSLAGYREVVQRLTTQRNLGIELDDPVAAYIRSHSSPDEKILIWGSQLGLAYLAHRQEPTAYIFYPLYVPSPFTVQMSETYYQDLLRQPPLYIVDSYPTNPDLLPSLDADIRRSQLQSTKIWPTLPENIGQVFDFISTNYRLETVINQYRIYRKNGK